MNWIALKERQPELGQAVLITDGNVVTAAIADRKVYEGGKVLWDACGFGGYELDWLFSESDITHWMPLPDCPKRSKEAD